MKNNILLQFLQETLNRHFTKSPKFFRIWQLVSGVLVLITGIPELLLEFNIILPESISFFANKFIAYAAAGAFWASLLTTQSKPVGSSAVGDVLKKTDQKKLPFTSSDENKKYNDSQKE